MNSYHINAKGEPGLCKAQKQCPFGDANFEHFSSQHEARQAYENVMAAKKQYGTDFITPHKLLIPPALQEVLSTLAKTGTPLIVGGAVRDSLTGVESKDIDIEVQQADLDTLVKTLKSDGYQVDEVGKEFGVLKVSKAGVITDLDISVPRRENRVGAHHRSFEVEVDTTMTVAEAGERRDFTFNAIYYDASKSILIDPHRGKKDFSAGIARHVSEKFAEDPLRVLRGVQFAARFDLKMASETLALSKTLAPAYETLSKERIQEEWGKFFTKGQNPAAGFSVLKATGWASQQPGLEEAISDTNLPAKLQEARKLPGSQKIVVSAALMAEKMSPSHRKDFLSKAIVGNDGQTRAGDMLSANNSDFATTEARKHYALKMARRGFTFVEYYNFASIAGDKEGKKFASEAIKEGVGEKPEPDLLMGKDVLALSSEKPGPWMGKLLREARDNQYAGKLTSKAEALQWLKSALKKSA